VGLDGPHLGSLIGMPTLDGVTPPVPIGGFVNWDGKSLIISHPPK